MAGISFCGWPDGKSFMDQEYVVPTITSVVLSEVVKDLADG